MRVLVKYPGLKPFLQETDDPFMYAKDLLVETHGWQSVTIEKVRFNERIAILVDQDGRRRCLRENFFTDDGHKTVGTAVFVLGIGEDFGGLTDPDIARLITFFTCFEGLESRTMERCFTCDKPYMLGENEENHECGK